MKLALPIITIAAITSAIFLAASPEAVVNPPEIIIPIPPSPGLEHAYPVSALTVTGPWTDRTADLIVLSNGDWQLPATPGATCEFYQILPCL
jgi:hypothetical protein